MTTTPFRHIHTLERARALGQSASVAAWHREQHEHALRSLELSQRTRLRHVHRSAITALAVDAVNEQYLVSTSRDGAIHFWNTCPAADDLDARSMVARDIRPTGIARHVSRAVTTVAWYPHDTGMYLTGSADDRVTVWDPFDMDAIFDFDLGHAVHHIALSPIATAHTLVAAATAEPNVRLCDIQSGSAVQALRGHTAGVWAVAWSPCAEWEVVSASADGTVRVWDIRKALACRKTLHVGAPVTGLAVTVDAAHAVLTVPGQGTAVWDLHDGTKVAGIRAGSGAAPRRTTNPALLPSRAAGHRHSAPPVYAVPWGAKVVVADLLDSGERRSRRTRVLRGLMAPAAAVTWAGSRARLWTGGEDGMVVCWEPPRWVGAEEEDGMEGVEEDGDRTGGDIVVVEDEGEGGMEEEVERPAKRVRRDNWSDDEDE